MDNALLNQDRISKEIQQSQIFYSPHPRNSVTTQNGSIVLVGQVKNITQSALSTANATQDIHYRDKTGEKNPTMQMSITERVVTEAILDLNIALRQHNSSIRQQSLVNNNSSFISMNESEKINLRKNRIQYQADGLLIQQFYKKEQFFIPIVPIKSKNQPFMLEIKEVFDGKRFEEEQEVFLAFDHLTNYYFSMKIYIVEKGSDDAILFTLDNANFIFDTNDSQNKNAQNIQLKAFCLENAEKNQLNLFFLQKTKPFFDSDSSSSNSENEDLEENNEQEQQQKSPAGSSNKKGSQCDVGNRTLSGKKKRMHNMSYTRKQDEKLQRTVRKYVKIARAYSFLGQPEMAINYYNRIFNNQNINKFNVNEVDALEELMFFLEDMEKESEAIKKADRLLEIFGKIGNIDKMKQILFFKGNLSIKIGDFKTAEKDYLKLLEYLNLEDGDEMSYFSGITYGKLADIQFILANNQKCLELLNDKYNTLIEIYKQQEDLPEILEMNDDEEEYQQFNCNNFETVQNQSENQASQNQQNQEENEGAQGQDNIEVHDARLERFKIIEQNFLKLKEKEKNHENDDEFDFEYLGGESKKVTFSEKQNKQQTEEVVNGNSEYDYENVEESHLTEGSDLQSEDIRKMAKDKYKNLRRNLFNGQQQVEQSPMLRNSTNSPQKKKFEILPNQNSCQQSMMKSEILRFDQKIVKELWNCSMQIADVYFQLEDIEFSLNYYTKSIEFAEKLFGKESLQVAQLYESIGLVRLENMDFDESQEAFQKSLQIKQKICVSDHPQLAFSYSYLGCLHAKFHMYKQAKEQYLKALTIFQHRYKENKKELSETYNNIANIYLNEAEIDLAISSYEKALELFVQLQQEIPPLHFAQIYENLGIAYFQSSKFDKSLPYFEEAESILLQLYDENHPTLSRIKNWKKNNMDRIDYKS